MSEPLERVLFLHREKARRAIDRPIAAPERVELGGGATVPEGEDPGLGRATWRCRDRTAAPGVDQGAAVQLDEPEKGQGQLLGLGPRRDREGPGRSGLAGGRVRRGRLFASKRCIESRDSSKLAVVMAVTAASSRPSPSFIPERRHCKAPAKPVGIEDLLMWAKPRLHRSIALILRGQAGSEERGVSYRRAGGAIRRHIELELGC